METIPGSQGPRRQTYDANTFLFPTSKGRPFSRHPEFLIHSVGPDTKQPKIPAKVPFISVTLNFQIAEGRVVMRNSALSSLAWESEDEGHRTEEL